MRRGGGARNPNGRGTLTGDGWGVMAGGSLQASTAVAAGRETRAGPTRSALRDFQTVLSHTVQRLSAVTGAASVVAWTLRDGAPYVCAASFRGDPPVTPSAEEFHALMTLDAPARLDRGPLVAIGSRHRLAAAACTRADGVDAGAVLLLGPEPVRPRTLATLGSAARRLTGPLAAANAADRLVRLDEQARRLDRLAALGALTSEIAHEVRNPLVSVKTFLQLLPERAGDPEFSEQFLSLVTDELRRMERLLDIVIEHARPPSGQSSPGSLPEAVESALALLYHRAQKLGVQLSASIPGDTPLVTLGDDGIRQVVMNLAINALEATPPGGTVRVTARALGSAVQLRVTDEGPGIEEALRERVFEPFHSDKSERPGGLGLAICHRIVTEAGGAITVQDGAAGGAEFCVRLPIAETE